MWTKTKVPAIPRHAQQCTDDLQLIQVNYFSKPWQCFGLHFLIQEAESRNTSYSKLIVKHSWEGCRTLTCLLNYSPSGLTISPFFLIARVSMVSWGRWSPMGFSRQEYWSGLPFPSPGDLPNPGIRPRDQTLVSGAAGSLLHCRWILDRLSHPGYPTDHQINSILASHGARMEEQELLGWQKWERTWLVGNKWSPKSPLSNRVEDEEPHPHTEREYFLEYNLHSLCFKRICYSILSRWA